MNADYNFYISTKWIAAITSSQSLSPKIRLVSAEDKARARRR